MLELSGAVGDAISEGCSGPARLPPPPPKHPSALQRQEVLTANRKTRCLVWSSENEELIFSFSSLFHFADIKIRDEAHGDYYAIDVSAPPPPG